MIEINNLAINNFVKFIYNNNYYLGYVNAIFSNNVVNIVTFDDKDFNVTSHEILGIDINDEFLIKNGFNKKLDINSSDYYGYDLHIYSNKINDCFINIDGFLSNPTNTYNCQIDDFNCCSLGGFECKYIHELQNGISLITKKPHKFII